MALPADCTRTEAAICCLLWLLEIARGVAEPEVEPRWRDRGIMPAWPEEQIAAAVPLLERYQSQLPDGWLEKVKGE